MRDDGDGGCHNNQPAATEEPEKPDVYVYILCSTMFIVVCVCVCVCVCVSRPEAAVSVSGWETVRGDLTTSEEVMCTVCTIHNVYIVHM